MKVLNFCGAALVLLLCGQVAHAACTTNLKEQRTLLEKEYGEAVVFRALNDLGNVIEVWRNEKGSSFSITATSPKGYIFVIDTGADAEHLTPNFPVKGSDS